MKFSTAACSVMVAMAAAAATTTGVEAFAPGAAVQQLSRTFVTTTTTTTTKTPTSLHQLSLSTNDNDDDVGVDASFVPNNVQAMKVAMSFLAASALAFSTTVTPLPSVDTNSNIIGSNVGVGGFEIHTGSVQPVFAADKTTSKQLSKEEQELIKAKKDYELSQQTLKAYEKLVSENKKTEQNAGQKLDSATKAAEQAKKTFVGASDKLSTAKNQKMPSAAIQELTTKSSTLLSFSLSFFLSCLLSYSLGFLLVVFCAFCSCFLVFLLLVCFEDHHASLFCMFFFVVSRSGRCASSFGTDPTPSLMGSTHLNFTSFSFSPQRPLCFLSIFFS